MEDTRQAILNSSIVTSSYGSGIPATNGDPLSVMLYTANVPDQYRSPWLTSRVVTGYVAAASAVILVLHALIVWALPRVCARVSSYSALPSEEENFAQAEEGAWLPRHIQAHGGRTIFAFQATRALLTSALFVLSIVGFWLEPDRQPAWVPAIHNATMLYASLLTASTVFLPAHPACVTSSHATYTLLALFASYAYRNIWPLFTFTLTPADLHEGPILWMKVVLAFLGGVALPLLEPYPYVPVDPKNPQTTVNEEQTASLVSFFLYFFLDSIITAAWRVPHLPADQLPVLADYDWAEHLVKKSFPYLDPFQGAKRGRNLFWGFCVTFKGELTKQFMIVLGAVITKIGLPIGTYKLLNSLENGGEGAIVHPWAWIVWLAAAPLANACFSEMYRYHTSSMLARIQAIITSLVFEHALRIRIKAETSTTSTTPSIEASAAKSAPESVVATSAATAETVPSTGMVQPDSAASEQSGSTPTGANGGDNDDATLHSRSETAASSSTAVSATSQDDAKKKKNEEKERPNKGGANLVGKINNLVTSDLASIVAGRDLLLALVSCPLAFLFSMVFLYVILGWSAFVGLAVMVVLMPVPAKGAKLMSGVEKKKMEATDARVKLINETMGMLRMVKLFGWEARVHELIDEKRKVELEWVWKRKMLRLATGILNYVVPLLHMIISYGTFTIVMKRELTAAIVFSSLTGFDLMRNTVQTMIYTVPDLLTANVSLKRVQDFLNETELLDTFEQQLNQTTPMDSSSSRSHLIGVGSASFTWTASSSEEGTLTPSHRSFRLRIEDDLVFHRGKLNLVIGATGSGKTSLLMALLGEMHYVPSGPGSWVSLPRDGGVALAVQESWVQNETIKDNILFGSPYDEERYKKVIYQCALTRDLLLFEAGDNTEVGEKGLTLSGGQKARITLARAIYSSAEILLLDDVLAALDVHTSRWIVNKCFKGDLLRDRTVILVTHNIAMTSPLASFVVAMGTDGRIASQGSVSDAVAKDANLADELHRDEQAIKQDAELGEDEDEDKMVAKAIEVKSGKLIMAEEVAMGHVGWPSMKLFLGALRGKWPVLFWVAYVFGQVMCEGLEAGDKWWMGWWAQQYSLRDRSEVNAIFYLGIYCVLTFATICCFIYSSYIWSSACIRVSQKIHRQLISSLLGSTFRWLDTTPTSRITTRCTQDIQSVDGPTSINFVYVFDTTLGIFAKTTAIMIFSPIFILPAILMGTIAAWLGQLYIKATMSVKREMSNAKAPVLASFNGAISGLTSIRAYRAQSMFREGTRVRIDRYSRSTRTFYNLNRWISIRVDVLSGLFSASLAAYLVYGPTRISPSNIGFSLNQAVSFTQMVVYWIRWLNQFEIEANSLERIRSYLEIEHEPKSTEAGSPPAYWPASGELRVEKLSARYSPDGPKVLEDISFHIKAGERIGVVGRTGSGKSSLTLALLRCILTEGSVHYDGLLTQSMNLDSLRSNVTIIPQVPELMSGTLRQNLDMFSQHDDATLNDALRAAGLTALQTEADETRLTLDSTIASGGGNLSVGQRQIVALGRAIVRQSKLLILDEATSAIDYDTDTIIQNSLRQELKEDVTVITVAHRLQTIMDSDKIMVLDAGRLVEFATPRELLGNEKSFLRALVDESADKDALYAMADQKA